MAKRAHKRSSDRSGRRPIAGGASRRRAPPNGRSQYASVGGITYSYDARGNLLSDGVRNFTYDIDNRLLAASAPTPVTLAYDPLNRLQTSTANGATTSFLYDGAFLAGEFRGNRVIAVGLSSLLKQRDLPAPNK